MNNKLVIFDLDGVLIDSRDIHYDALNSALIKINPKFIITREEHLSKFDGLGTSVKLKIIFLALFIMFVIFLFLVTIPLKLQYHF